MLADRGAVRENTLRVLTRTVTDGPVQPRRDMTDHYRLKFPLSLISRAADRWRHRLVSLDADRLKRRAEQFTGLTDYGDNGGFGRRFQATLESAHRIDWNFVGRIALRTNLLWHLCNRLRLVHLLERHPEVHDVELEPPVVILGLFRTGTTFLHNVMAADPAFHTGFMWEFSYPAGRRHDPMGDTRWRRRHSAMTLKQATLIVPDHTDMHTISAEQLEEDFFLLENDFANMKFVVGLGDFQLGWDLLNADLGEPYALHRLQLQILSASRGPGRWLLKCPWHLWNLGALLDVYPDAKVVHTHRDVAKAIGSQCSLTARISCRIKRNPELHDVGRFWSDYALAGIERGLAARERLPPSQVHDVRLRDLRADPGGVLRDMYDRFDLGRGDQVFAAMEARAQDMPTMQHGVHEYDIETFGLTADEVRAKFASYGEQFGV